jgi:hypothetical protein
MARKPISKPLLVRREFEPVRERERPWLMAFERLLRGARRAETAEPDHGLITDVPESSEHVGQGV